MVLRRRSKIAHAETVRVVGDKDVNASMELKLLISPKPDH